MKLNIFSDEWRGTRSENTFLRILVPLLIISNIACGSALLLRSRETVLIPPNITEVMTINDRWADASYKKSWALFIATLVGNITPSNVDFVNDQLSGMMDSATYHTMKNTLAVQVSEIHNNNLTIEFESTQIMYEPETDKVFVIGKSMTSGTNGRLNKESRVFEIQVSIKNGKPLITELVTYADQPRTTAVLARAEKQREGDEARALKASKR